MADKTTKTDLFAAARERLAQIRASAPSSSATLLRCAQQFEEAIENAELQITLAELDVSGQQKRRERAEREKRERAEAEKQAMLAAELRAVQAAVAEDDKRKKLLTRADQLGLRGSK